MKSNQLLKSAIIMLERKGRKEKTGIWRDAAEYLSSGTATWPEVNVSSPPRILMSVVFPEPDGPINATHSPA
jgi:ribosomal protein L18E